MVVPTRSASGQRLYTLENIEHLRTLKGSVDAGLSAGEAHADLVRRLRENANGLRVSDGAAVREQARRLRVEVAETQARTAAEHERAARHLTRSPSGRRRRRQQVRELAREAEERGPRERSPTGRAALVKRASSRVRAVPRDRLGASPSGETDTSSASATDASRRCRSGSPTELHARRALTRRWRRKISWKRATSAGRHRREPADLDRVVDAHLAGHHAPQGGRPRIRRRRPAALGRLDGRG